MTDLTSSKTGSGGRHIDDAVFKRLFEGGVGGPLSAVEFSSLHLHLDRCVACQKRFAEAQARARIGDEPLTAGQVETILNVVHQKAVAAQVAARAAPPAERPWFVRFLTDLRVAGAVAAAAVLGLSLHHFLDDGGLRPRGQASPARDVRCFDENSDSGTLSPMSQPTGYCPVGQTPSIHAKQVEGLPWVTMVICDGGRSWKCELAGDSAKHDSGQTEVSANGPPMRPGQRLRIFTIWSRDALDADSVERASSELRNRAADPNATDALPIVHTKQLAHTAVAGDAPPS